MKSRVATVEEVAARAARRCMRPDARPMSRLEMQRYVEWAVWKHVLRSLARRTVQR